MKNIKTYLNIALAVTFCASLNIVAMEKERSRASHEWSKEEPIGEASTSSESGMDERVKELLTARIKRLTNMKKMMQNRLQDKISRREFEEITRLYQYTEEALTATNDMLLGIIPINLQLITQKLDTIIKKWNQKESTTESSSY